MRIVTKVGCARCTWGKDTGETTCWVAVRVGNRTFRLHGDAIQMLFPTNCAGVVDIYEIDGTWMSDRTSILVSKIEKALGAQLAEGNKP